MLETVPEVESITPLLLLTSSFNLAISASRAGLPSSSASMASIFRHTRSSSVR